MAILCWIAHLRFDRLVNAKRVPSQAKHQEHQDDRESTQADFHKTPRGPVREDNILAISDEEHDQVLTALVGNWDRISSVAQSLKIDWLGVR
jgi:hypothetical protein